MAKTKISNKKIKTKSIKKEPINSRSIWHIILGILALAIIVVIMILAIPKENPEQRVIPVAPEDKVDTEDQTDTTPKTETKQPSSSVVVDKKKNTEGTSGGSSGSSDSNTDGNTAPEESLLKCANWFGNNLNWEEITVATQLGNSGPWGLMNNNECTEEIIGDQGVYSCALSFEEGGFSGCAGDCKDGKCLPCEDCVENVAEFSCADTIDNDGDGTIDCLDDDCNTLICAENSYCQENVCVEEVEECSYVDTDGGNNHLVKGTCDDGKAIVYTDYCQDGETLVEYWLGIGEACYDGCQGGSTLFYCPSLGNGWECSEGACVEESPCEFSDTDGGFETPVKGTCTGSDGLDYVDICEDNKLIEYFPGPENECDSSCGGISLNCDFGCGDGVCLPDPDEQCREFCTGIQLKESYIDGSCIDRHGNTAEITCTAEGHTYEIPPSRKCTDTADACCCIGELEIQ